MSTGDLLVQINSILLSSEGVGRMAGCLKSQLRSTIGCLWFCDAVDAQRRSALYWTPVVVGCYPVLRPWYSQNLIVSCSSIQH